MVASQEKRLEVVLPVVIDSPDANIRVSDIELKTYTSPCTNRRPSLISSAHIEKMKKLPF